jgi:hypothetical protein
MFWESLAMVLAAWPDIPKQKYHSVDLRRRCQRREKQPKSSSLTEWSPTVADVDCLGRRVGAIACWRRVHDDSAMGG